MAVFGVLLLALPSGAAGAHASYCVETCLLGLRSDHPVGLFPFADTTGGDLWALNFRPDPRSPSVVLIDHEVDAEEGLVCAATRFGAFMALAGAPP